MVVRDGDGSGISALVRCSRGFCRGGLRALRCVLLRVGGGGFRLLRFLLRGFVLRFACVVVLLRTFRGILRIRRSISHVRGRFFGGFLGRNVFRGVRGRQGRVVFRVLIVFFFLHGADFAGAPASAVVLLRLLVFRECYRRCEVTECGKVGKRGIGRDAV